MTITVERFNGHELNDATYAALFGDASPFTRTAQQVQVQPPGAWPVHIRTEQRPRPIVLHVEILSGDLNTAQRQLQEWFAPGAEGELEITEDGISKVIDAVCVGFQRYQPSTSAFTVSLVATDPRWRSLNPISGASLITLSGGGFTVNNPGNSTIDDPLITLRPVSNKAAASGYLYKLESVIAWRAARPAPNYAVELTEGWDHATEVGAGRSQADGDDVRVLVDGVEVPRWFGEHANNDANSAATKVWANLNFSPRRTATLLAAMTVASPTEGDDLEVATGGTLGWPRTGALLIDDEVITYSGRTESNANGRAAFTGIQRGRRDTTVATHSASATMYWIEHRVQIVYGNTGVAAPDSRADLKPLLDLTSSTVSNERHEWLNFADSAYPGRSMQWLTRSRTQDDQYDKILAPTASPVTALTWEYQSGGAVAGKPVGNTYYRDFPTGTGGSGGNVASLTRVLADTLGMWIYGIDDAGQEVVLQKFAGALTSASANITQPTNPVYRLECWAFNQVVGRRPEGYDWTAADSTALTTTFTDNAQQILIGAAPIDIVAVIAQLYDVTGGSTVTVRIAADDGSDGIGTTAIVATGTQVTTSAGYQTLVFSFATPFVLQASTRYWIGMYRNAVATSNWAKGYVKYSGGKMRDATAISSLKSWDFKIVGRQASSATAFTRIDGQSYADDSDQVTVDGVTVYLSTSESPYVALKSRKDAYRFVGGALYNETTGDTIKANALCGMSNELRIDIGTGVAVNVDEENGASFAAGVEFSDPDAKFTLAPGTNSLRFVETGLTGVNVAVDAYARWE